MGRTVAGDSVALEEDEETELRGCIPNRYVSPRDVLIVREEGTAAASRPERSE